MFQINRLTEEGDEEIGNDNDNNDDLDEDEENINTLEEDGEEDQQTQYDCVGKKKRRQKEHASHCIGGNEILASPATYEPKFPLGPPTSTRTDRGRKLSRHFHDILKSISSCIAEFVIFILVWVVHYFLTLIYTDVKCPLDTVMIILVHTAVNSVLYSSRYTTFHKKLFKRRRSNSFL